jgi:superfamily II RNA helicase
MDFAFHLHQMGHMQAMLTNGFPVDIASLPPLFRENVEKLMAAKALETKG